MDAVSADACDGIRHGEPDKFGVWHVLHPSDYEDGSPFLKATMELPNL